MVTHDEILRYYAYIASIVGAAFTMPLAEVERLIRRLDNRQVQVELARALAPGETPAAVPLFLQMVHAFRDFRWDIELLAERLMEEPGDLHSLQALVESLGKGSTNGYSADGGPEGTAQLHHGDLRGPDGG
jgi:hypothetical protein